MSQQDKDITPVTGPEAQLIEAIGNISQGFVLYDEDERFVICNARYREIRADIADLLVPGTPFVEVLRASVEQRIGVIADVDKVEAEEWIASRLARFRDPGPPELRHYTDDRWEQVDCRRTSSGGRIIIRTDVSERKRAEAQILAANEELESRVSARTVDLQDEIEERKKVERELRDSEERYREAAELAHLGHWTWDAAGKRTTFCSEVCARIHGLTPAEYIARTSTLDVFPLVLADDRARVQAEFANLRNGREIDIEYRISTPSGEVRHVREIAKPVMAPGGGLISEHGTIVDITERHALEERLRQSQKMEAVAQLAGGIAHDFNNLLTVVLGNAELLSNELAGERKKKGAIVRAAARGAELTQNLLAFSRIQPLAPRNLELAALVAGMSDMLRRALGETIEITTTAEPGLWTARADPGQVENAIMNLAINARDAMTQGGALHIDCRNIHLDEDGVADFPEVMPGDYVMLVVADSGCGMDPATREHAFEPFFTTKEVGEGSGLGLSMVYGFAKQSNGHVAIASAPGIGTSVSLYLPRSAEEAREAVAATENGATPLGRGETLLVIEDDDGVREFTVLMLEDLGYRVLEAADAAAARRILAQEAALALVLSDVVLPGDTDGPELAEQARQSRRGLKFIFMSGYPDDMAKVANIRAADHILLNKPFRRQQLAEAVREALD